jgi:hypothetical protein
METKGKAMKNVRRTGLALIAIAGFVAAACPNLYANLGNVYVKDNGKYIGQYEYGSQITHNVVLYNWTLKPETIKLLTPACHCTIVKANCKTIQPLSSAVITMNIDSSLLPVGKMGKQVSVFFDDGKVVDAVVLLSIVPKHV